MFHRAIVLISFLNNTIMIISNTSELITNQIIGLTSGCFDLFHYYQLQFLQQCKKYCDILIVGIDSDELVYINKNKIPQINQRDRLAIINSLKVVDFCYLQGNLNTFEMFSNEVDIIFKNDNKIYGNELIAKEKTMIIKDIENAYSTTDIINKIKNQYACKIK